MKTLQQTYQHHLEQSLIKPDPEQAKLVDKLNQLSHHLQQKCFFWQKRKAHQGLYVWGKVGRGKTYLMDLFYESLPFKDKHRSHFHRFMLDVHERLNAHKGKSDPLKIIAKEFASKARVLCFDEFVVEDISDAMVLANFFAALFAEGVTLVATSNTAPHHLYWNGLQRQQFLPCIELIERHCEVFHLTHEKDYRRQGVIDQGVYFHPLNHDSDEALMQVYKRFSEKPFEKAKAITVDHRKIKTIAYVDRTIWFDFKAICKPPRGKRDYLLLCDDYDNFVLSHVKQMTEGQNDLTRNFISLVDVLYDARKHLAMSAEVSIEQLYSGDRFAFEFKRIISRLTEMQSSAYLQQYDQL